MSSPAFSKHLTALPQLTRRPQFTLLRHLQEHGLVTFCHCSPCAKSEVSKGTEKNSLFSITHFRKYSFLVLTFSQKKNFFLTEHTPGSTSVAEDHKSNVFQESNYSDTLCLEIFNSQWFGFTPQGQASEKWEVGRSEWFPKGQETPVTSESSEAQSLSSNFLRANCSKAQRDPPPNQFLQRLQFLARIAFSFIIFFFWWA